MILAGFQSNETILGTINAEVSWFKNSPKPEIELAPRFDLDERLGNILSIAPRQLLPEMLSGFI